MNINGIIRKKLIEFKFKDASYLYRSFAKLMLKNEKLSGFLKEHCDIIIPVPIHKKRKRQRGYNQSALILNYYGKRKEEICIENKALYKIKNTKPQSKLDKQKRKDNIKDAYLVKRKELVQGRTIILFDDIYTTGSTVNACSEKLKKAGAKEIHIVTIAKD